MYFLIHSTERALKQWHASSSKHTQNLFLTFCIPFSNKESQESLEIANSRENKVKHNVNLEGLVVTQDKDMLQKDRGM